MYVIERDYLQPSLENSDSCRNGGGQPPLSEEFDIFVVVEVLGATISNSKAAHLVVRIAEINVARLP